MDCNCKYVHPPPPPPRDSVSVWMDKKNYQFYVNGGVASAESVKDDNENRTINVMVETAAIRTIYEHFDYHEFIVKR